MDAAKRISAREFKAKCLKQLTKRGKPVARLVPLASELPDFS